MGKRYPIAGAPLECCSTTREASAGKTKLPGISVSVSVPVSVSLSLSLSLSVCLYVSLSLCLCGGAFFCGCPSQREKLRCVRVALTLAARWPGRTHGGGFSADRPRPAVHMPQRRARPRIFPAALRGGKCASRSQAGAATARLTNCGISVERRATDRLHRGDTMPVCSGALRTHRGAAARITRATRATRVVARGRLAGGCQP